MSRLLDWRTHTIGPDLPCRLCGRLAMCRDAAGRPCHKTCAEQQQQGQSGGGQVIDLIAHRDARAQQRTA